MDTEYKKCPQCGKLIEGEPHKAEIWKNRNRYDMEFCSSQCAAHYQMGCEG